MAAPASPLRRERRRRRRFGLDEKKRGEIVARVLDFYQKDYAASASDRDRRLQRYAKYRQWTSGDDGWPWPGASDQLLPDMTEASIRMQDTLHNAVMSARPIVVSRAIQKKDEEKQRALDAHHDTQLFVEQEGERFIEHACESFVNDPAVTIFTPWVRELRRNSERRDFGPIPPDTLAPAAYFRQILTKTYPEARYREKEGSEGWDWVLVFEDEGDATASFYTTDDAVELEVMREPVVFDAPSPRVLDYDDVIVPPGVANLQIPSPSNPGGAPHVILREYPTVDEIESLRRDGAYDLIKREDVEAMEAVSGERSHRERKDQQDDFEGVETDKNNDPPQRCLTRLVCFDIFDIDGDGRTEDVIFWVVKETQTLLRVRLLSEMYPGRRPMRPLSEASFLPVGGRRAGISLLELTEGLHDWLKETVDQMVDNGTLANLPIFKYRPTSSMKPEMLRLAPGDGIPLSDPKNDFVTERFDNQNQAFFLNLAVLIRQQMERLTLQGDIQAGRVPAGGSSALRTLGGIQTLLSQGEARPERILRRFFMALRQMHRQMHRLNRYFLSDEKAFRAAGEILQPTEDPWITLKREDFDVDMEFDFHANVLNSSKQAVQQALSTILPVFVSDIALQLGIVGPDQVYRMLRKFGEAFGQNVDGYLSPPSPQALESPIFAEEAMATALDGMLPSGSPAEGSYAAHLARLQQIEGSPLFGAFPVEHLSLYRAYRAQVTRMAGQEQKLAAQAQAAGSIGQGVVPRGGGNGAAGPPLGPSEAFLQPGELRDESLPTAGGGANG